MNEILGIALRELKWTGGSDVIQRKKKLLDEISKALKEKDKTNIKKTKRERRRRKDLFRFEENSLARRLLLSGFVSFHVTLIK